MKKTQLPNFEQSMLTSRADFTHEWDLIRETYEQYRQESHLDYSDQSAKIPKMIHQIWLGSPLPEAYIQLCETWKVHHPTWKYILWTDEMVEREELRTGSLYKQIRNFGAKSDILRIEIINRYGGLYADTDFYCLKSLDALHESRTFYAGIHDHYNFVLPNSIFGAIPNHPILESILAALSSAKLTDAMLADPEDLMQLVGPGRFTDHIMQYLRKHEKADRSITIFPSSFFYPSPPYLRHMGHDYLLEFNKPESFANHLWEVSWLKPPKKNIFAYLRGIAKAILRP